MQSEVDAGHYFDEEPAVESDRRTIELPLPDTFLVLASDAGVFSHGQVDSGTRFLLQEMPPIDADTTVVLDLGCGYGPIALAAATRAPQATVWAVDVNARARDLTAENAEANAIDNVRVAHPDEVPPDLRFDLIVSNPPIRIGKTALHELLSTWLDRLTPTGRAILVVQKHLGSDSLATWLDDQGWRTSRIGSRRGYRLLDVRARRTAS